MADGNSMTSSFTGTIDELEIAKPYGQVLMSPFDKTFAALQVTDGKRKVARNTGATTEYTSFTAAGGIIAGDGTLIGNVTVNSGGGIAPEDPNGCLTITANLRMSSASTFHVNVDGLTPCTQHSKLSVSGTVGLGNAALSG